MQRRKDYEIAQALRRWRADPMSFRKEAILMEDGTPFGEVMEHWQEEDFAAMDKHGGNTFRQLPRGHSKTFDLGGEAAKDLLLGPQRQRNYIMAADQDQTMLLFNDVANIFRRNPILAPSAEILKKSIRIPATDSELIPLASDAPGNMGLRPYRIYGDEIAEWQDDKMWNALYTASGKVKGCRIHVISTPGWSEDSVGWRVHEIARTEPSWLLIERGQCASWISREWLDEQRRTLPAHVYARLHESKWVFGEGAFLTLEEVNRVFSNDWVKAA